MNNRFRFRSLAICLLATLPTAVSVALSRADDTSPFLSWSELPSLPNPLGVAGPCCGVHDNALIVAGGANFPLPVWETQKVWHDQIYVLFQTTAGLQWASAGKLPRPLAYAAAVSTPQGVVCMGGNDAKATYRDVLLLRWNAASGRVTIDEYPPLPAPCAYGAACLVGNVIYLAGGQSGSSLNSALSNLWALDLARRGSPHDFQWRELAPCPGPPRALNLTVAQSNDDHECLYVISGRRRMPSGTVEFLRDVWQYTPANAQWRQRSDVPRCVMAGTAIASGQRHVLVIGGDDGALFHQADELQDRHPGFPRQTLIYDTVSDAWTTAGSSPMGQVTTIAVDWRGSIVIPSGEVRPRVRSPKIWRATTSAVASAEAQP